MGPVAAYPLEIFSVEPTLLDEFLAKCLIKERSNHGTLKVKKRDN